MVQRRANSIKQFAFNREFLDFPQNSGKWLSWELRTEKCGFFLLKFNLWTPRKYYKKNQTQILSKRCPIEHFAKVYILLRHPVQSQSLNITEKVSINIASEASGQKLIKNAKSRQFWRVLENIKLAVKQCYQTGQFQKVKNLQKMPKTFQVISKQSEKNWNFSNTPKFRILEDFLKHERIKRWFSI